MTTNPNEPPFTPLTDVDMIEKYKDLTTIAKKLAEFANDNKHYRQVEKPALEAQVREAQAKAPADGAIVLTAEQAQQWQAYQALGSPADLDKRIRDGEQAIEKATALERDATIRDVATVAGYDFDVLKDKGGALTYTIKEETQDGKAVRVAYVQQDGKDTPLHEYAQSNWPKYLPALQQSPTVIPAAPRVAAQSAVGGTAATDLATRFIEQRNQQAEARPNPLAPAAAKGM